MENRIVTVIGGARSGKSTFAQNLAEKLDKTTVYIATAHNKDGEMTERILKHQESRPTTWKTVEAPYDLATAIRESGSEVEVIVVDCVTLFLSNLLLSGLGDLGTEDDPQLPPHLEQDLLVSVKEVVRAAQDVSALVIFVSNEVGWGIVPLYHSARVYRDVVGRTNQLLAAASSKVFHVQAGIPIELKSQEVSIDQLCEELKHGR